MLCIIGYPAFAVDDEKLKEETGERIIENLMVIMNCLRESNGNLA